MVVTIENKIKSYPNTSVKKKRPTSGKIRETYFVPIEYVSDKGWSSEIACDNYGDGYYEEVTKGFIKVDYVKWFTGGLPKFGHEDVFFEWEGKKQKIQDGGRNAYVKVLDDEKVINAFIEYLPKHVSEQFPEIRSYLRELEDSQIKLKDDRIFKSIKEDRNGRDCIRLSALSKHLGISEKEITEIYNSNLEGHFNLEEDSGAIRWRKDNILWGFDRNSIPEVVEIFEKYYLNVKVEVNL